MGLRRKEYERYARQIQLDAIGVEGQRKLKEAKVLCVGAGGLGSPLLLYLAAAGVGTLGIVDFDVVEVSNLQRQILFSTAACGQSKVSVAKKRLQDLNPLIDVRIYPQKLKSDNVLAMMAPYDIIADASDNFTTRYLVNDACHYLKKPHVSASIYQFEGQCSVFSNETGCYRCLFPEKPLPMLAPSCVDSGVLGVVPGIMGTIQGNELLKYILGIGNTLAGRLLCLDAYAMTFREFIFTPDKACLLCGNQQSFVSLYHEELGMRETENIPEISVHELLEWQEKGVNFLLLDVREPAEHAEIEMGGTLIPSGELATRFKELDPHQLTVVHCRGGGRSKRAVQFLQSMGFLDVRNLAGGITAWQKVKATECR